MLYVITGPPAAGKTTYIREHALPGDIIIDYDTLCQAVTTGTVDKQEWPAHIKKMAHATRFAAITQALKLCSKVDVYLIHGMPDSEALTKYRLNNATIITIDPGRDIVTARVTACRPAAMRAIVDSWYDTYTQEVDMYRDSRGQRSEPRSGHRWRAYRNEFKKRCQAAQQPCHICREPIRYDREGMPDSFELDHYQPVSTHPHLVYDPTNARASHKRCNRARGATPVVQGEWVSANW